MRLETTVLVSCVLRTNVVPFINTAYPSSDMWSTDVQESAISFGETAEADRLMHPSQSGNRLSIGPMHARVLRIPRAITGITARWRNVVQGSRVEVTMSQSSQRL